MPYRKRHRRLVSLGGVFCAAVCSLHATRVAASTDSDVDPKRAIALVLAGQRLDAGPGLAFKEETTHHPQGHPGQKAVFDWQARGSLLDGELRCRMIVPGMEDLVSIRSGGAFYYVARRDFRWLGSISSSSTEAFPLTSGFQRYMRPLDDKLLVETLDRRPVAHASSDGERLEMVVVLDEAVHTALLKERTISGVVGWKCVFTASPTGLSLAEVDELMTTTTMTDLDPITGKQVWKESTEGMPGLSHSVQGRTLWVRNRRLFSDYVTVGGARVPRRIRQEWKSGWTDTVLDVEAEEASVGEHAFAFRPPPEYGPCGVLTDRRTGESRYFGGLRLGEKGTVASAVRSIERQEPSFELFRGAMLWVCITVGAGMVLVSGWMLMRRARRVHV